MKKTFFIFSTSLCLLLSQGVAAQNVNRVEQKLWTEADRKYLLDSLSFTRDALIKETENLTESQWNFKESPDRWSIKEVTEHIDLWELLLLHEVSKAIDGGPHPEWMSKPDSFYYDFILEEKAHVSRDYTRPLGLNSGVNNIDWFLKMRNQSIDLVKNTDKDLRTFHLNESRPNVHQVFIYIFGHVERHLRQIKKIKANINYPSK
jgi:hypothetical protein